MQGAEGQSGAIDHSLELHEATGVDGDDGGCAGFLDGIDLGAGHGAGNLREFDGERAAEAAAFFRDIHFGEREPLDMSEQFSRARFDAQLAEGVAAVVIGDDAVEPGADILDTGHLEQEARKFPDSRLQPMDLGEQLGIVLEDVRVVVRDHGRARAGGHDDVLAIAEHVEEMPGDSARFIRVAGVEGGLAAAGLGRGEIDLITEVLQHLRDGDADLREGLIDDAGDKQGDAGAQYGSLTCPAELKMEAVELVTVSDIQPREENYLALEQGNVLYFPRTPFAFGEEERELLRSTGLSSSSHHKNIAYRPAEDKVTGYDPAAVSDPAKLREVMRTYSERALAFMWKLLPRYMEKARIDFASFRPQEEEGRDLATKKRNDLLHVDAFPTRPTGGDLILRFFTNIHQTKPRVWETFGPVWRAGAAVRQRGGIGGSGEASEGIVWQPLVGCVRWSGGEAIGV